MSRITTVEMSFLRSEMGLGRIKGYSNREVHEMMNIGNQDVGVNCGVAE